MSALYDRRRPTDTAVRNALSDAQGVTMHEAITRARIEIGRHVGPWFWPAFYIVPKWKRDKWHRIACDDETCTECETYYRQLDEDFTRLYG